MLTISRRYGLPLALLLAAACGDPGSSPSTGDLSEATSSSGAPPALRPGAAPAAPGSAGHGDVGADGGEPSEDPDAGPDGEPDAGPDAGADLDASEPDAGPDPSISVAGLRLPEGANGLGPLSFTVTLSAPSSREVTVDFATADGTASSRADAPFGADYTPATGRLSFAPGDVTKVVTVSVQGDPWREGDETFSLELSRPTNASLATSSALAIIADDDANPVVSLDDAIVIEGNAGVTPARFGVRLSAPSALPISVHYRTIDDTALGGEDFDAVSDGLVSFAPGETSHTIDIPVRGDTTFEQSERFAIELSAPSETTLGRSRAMATIQNDDGAPLPTVAIASKTFVEGSAGRWLAAVPATLSAASTSPVTVDFETRDGTASSGVDYESTAGALTFAPGETSKDVIVPVLGDASNEADETFVVRLVGARGANVAVSDATVTLTNDDATPTITIADVAIPEGNNGATTMMAFTLTLSAASERQVSIGYTSIDGTATIAGSDYVGVDGTVVFAPLETTKTIFVPVTGDNLDEADETLTIALSDPVGATLGAKSAAVGTLRNDDRMPQLLLASVSDPEGADVHTVDVTVRLDRPSGRPVEVKFASFDGDATAPSDYVATAGTLRFAPGQTSLTIPVTVNGDAIAEPDQKLGIRFSEPVNVRMIDTTASVLLINDDGALPVITLLDANADEDSSSGIWFRLELNRAAQFDIDVTFKTVDGTAIGGKDYRSSTGVVTIRRGMTSQSLWLDLIDDSVFEGSERFGVDIATSTPTVTIARSHATGTIRENEAAPGVSILDMAILEGSTDTGIRPALVEVRLDKQSDLPVTINFATQSGTAIPTSSPGGTDYVSASGQLVIPPGQTQAFIQVDLVADRTREPDESFLVQISAPVNARIVDPIAVCDIINDD